jgi:hypothetical protein
MTLNAENVTDEFRKSMGSSFDEFLVTCSFNQVACNNSLSWVWYFDYFYGNC